MKSSSGCVSIIADEMRAPAPIVESITPADLAPGAVYRRFAAGTRAICLHQDARVQELWTAMVENVGDGLQFWNHSIFALARNHLAGQTRFGDVLRFAPGQYGHLARKVAFYPDTKTGNFWTFPDYRENATAIDRDVLQLAWNLAMQVQQSSLPHEVNESDYAVTVELLKYPDSGDDLERIFDLIRDSAGGNWTTLGQDIDLARASARGVFDRPVIRDLFGLLSLVPGVGRLLNTINAAYADRPLYKVDDDERIVGPPHTDGSRCLTMLAGDRNVMRTEAYNGHGWTEIPVQPATLSVFPGRMFPPELGVTATTHRYTMKRAASETARPSRNLTLCLGVTPRALVGAA